ncbi:cyclic peptide export ABC transporter [Chryseobacterium sp. PTM-20240506]|uniref:cyclic peptide export ABC transporter n=1 Tax=unclassified Chryseobacterium TaxID=2593645 RepID=UPI002358294D|nr:MULTISPECIES: cyclic peptide export ABC transporter [unclassified Chryseobacterium]MDC8104561.1 cyclic peptide export ABC transporter [Chryseobacterium sp. B21-037]MDQ1804170.1 cyclic peptide export ABC transporter [Chryseobacterium sp. CKR4-1]
MLKIKSKHIILISVYAVISSLLSFAIIYIINNTLSNQLSASSYIYITFFAFVVYAYLLSIFFQRELNKITFELLSQLEKKLFQKILDTPLIKIEKLGTQRFYTAVEDTRTFYSLPAVVTAAFSSLLMVILCLFYLVKLSPVSAVIILVAILIIAGIYYLVMNSLSKSIEKVKKYNEHYFGYVQDVISGFKELMISDKRRKKLLENYVYENRTASYALDFKISFSFLSIGLISQYGMYIIMGIILFILPELGWLKREFVIPYVLVLLFIAGPINNLINLQDVVTRLFVANKRLETFYEDFKNEKIVNVHNKELAADFSKLNFRNIHFNYKNDNADANFELGPINLEINKGEVIFIVGGNGSGKSTFINILSGLYVPDQGDIFFDGEKINSEKEIQNLISAVFTSNHLFSQNYDDYILENNPKYKILLETFKLENIVKDDSEESARRSFSKGQSKRMALIFALLEDKPIVVLDEWAADQDPYFRKYFYEELIPKLKSQGKTIIAVTHDDRYFHYCDKLLKFDYGKIVKEDIPANFQNAYF